MPCQELRYDSHDKGWMICWEGGKGACGTHAVLAERGWIGRRGAGAGERRPWVTQLQPLPLESCRNAAAASAAASSILLWQVAQQ